VAFTLRCVTVHSVITYLNLARLSPYLAPTQAAWLTSQAPAHLHQFPPAAVWFPPTPLSTRALAAGAHRIASGCISVLCLRLHQLDL
jgi:hypothetical protein